MLFNVYLTLSHTTHTVSDSISSPPFIEHDAHLQQLKHLNFATYSCMNADHKRDDQQLVLQNLTPQSMPHMYFH